MTRALLALTLAALAQLGPASSSGGGPAPASVSQAHKQQALAAHGRLPLAFVPNAGQAATRIRFQAQGDGFTFAFTDQEALLSFVARVGPRG